MNCHHGGGVVADVTVRAGSTIKTGNYPVTSVMLTTASNISVKEPSARSMGEIGGVE